MPDVIDAPTATDATQQPATTKQLTATQLARLRKEPRSNPTDPFLRESAKALYSQGLTFQSISDSLNIPSATLRSWAVRNNWKAVAAKTKQVRQLVITRKNVNDNAPGIQAASTKVRELMARTVESQAEALANANVNVKALGNTPDGQGLASIAKTLADTASVVFDWSSSHAPGVVVVGLTEQYDSEAESINTPAIAIESEVSQSQELSALDTTTGSVQPEQINDNPA